MDEPSEAAIAEVCEFASLDPVDDRALVIAALRAKNGSIQDVVLSYYDDPAKFRQLYMWDETSFIGDRDGPNGSSVPSFNIQAPDDTGSSSSNSRLPVIHGVTPNNYHVVPPSRPPSRVQSPLSRVADWNAADVGASSNMAREDQELERALAESAAMSGLHTPQETGVTASDPYVPIGPQLPTDMPFFGPASRDAYEPDQWAMVHKTLEPQEPDPSGRMRAEGTPAFLRSRQTGYDASTLSALLTVLHAIPLARNSFLAAGEQPASYGQNPEWWKGERIDPVGVPEPGQTTSANLINIADSDEDISYEQQQQQQSLELEGARELIDELHRLMAFLDRTTRAYGTADRIADSKLARECNGVDADQNLFEALRRLALPGMQQAFFSDVQLLPFADLNAPVRSESYAILDLKVDSDANTDTPLSAPSDLYSAMDNLYWEDLYQYYPGQESASVVNSNMAVVSRLAPVQILHLGVTPNHNTPKEFEVPAVLYLDRYLQENKQRAAGLQVQLQKVYDALHRIDTLMYTLKTYVDHSDPNKPVARDRVILSEQAINFAVQKEWQQKAQVAWERYTARKIAAKDADANTSGHGFDFSVADVDTLQPATKDELGMRRFLQAEMVVHIQKLKSIKKKAAKLNAEKEALEELVCRLRRKYTVPSAAEDWSPTQKYMLRGVVVSPTKFYFCRREAPTSPDSKPMVPEMTKLSKSADNFDFEQPDEPNKPDKPDGPKEPAEASTDTPVEGSAGGSEARKEGEIETGQEKGKGKAEATDEEDLETAPSQTTATKSDQWWMVVYSAQDASPITVEKTTVDIARAAAFSESRALTLVYAKDSILDEEDAPLSAALENFMRFDNRFFKQELKDERPRSEKKRQQVEAALPTSPLKRHQRQRSASFDSMASNMASLGNNSNFGTDWESNGDATGMDLDMEKMPLISLANNQRFPLDADEGAYNTEHTRPFSSSNAHEWTFDQPSPEQGIEVQEQEFQTSEANNNVSGVDMADLVLPQREVDMPAMGGIAAAAPADLELDASTSDKA